MVPNLRILCVEDSHYLSRKISKTLYRAEMFYLAAANGLRWGKIWPLWPGWSLS